MRIFFLLFCVLESAETLELTVKFNLTLTHTQLTSFWELRQRLTGRVRKQQPLAVTYVGVCQAQTSP